jgi:hypothetical protein
LAFVRTRISGETQPTADGVCGRDWKRGLQMISSSGFRKGIENVE